MPRKSKSTSGADLAARIGVNIKNARNARSLTQSELAEILNLENATISRIETGAQMPSIERLDEISKVLKVSLTALVADSKKSSAIVEMLADVLKDMPVREQKYLYELAATYAAHLRAGKKK